MKLVIAIILCAFCIGCESIFNHFDGKSQYYEHKVIIHDTTYDVYLNPENKWVSDKSKAKQWLYYDALRFVETSARYHTYEIEKP